MHMEGRGISCGTQVLLHFWLAIFVLSSLLSLVLPPFRGPYTPPAYASPLDPRPWIASFASTCPAVTAVTDALPLTAGRAGGAVAALRACWRLDSWA